MKPDVDIELCDELVKDLSDPGYQWVSSFRAMRGYLPRIEAELLTEQTVAACYPAGDRMARFERRSWGRQAIAAVTVMRRLSIVQGTDLDEFSDFDLPDELKALTGQLKGLFSREEGYGLELPHYGEAFATEIDNEPSVIPEFLKQGLFASVILVTFELERP